MTYGSGDDTQRDLERVLDTIGLSASDTGGQIEFLGDEPSWEAGTGSERSPRCR